MTCDSPGGLIDDQPGRRVLWRRFAKRGAVSTALRDALTRQFDAQQKRRAHEIGKIEERLGKLKDTMKKRDSAKDAIIGRCVDELTGVTDDLGWEETGVPARVRAIEANFGLPGVAPVPAAPRAFPGTPAPGGPGGGATPPLQAR